MLPDILSTLLESDEPSIRLKILRHLFGHAADSAKIRQLQEEIRTSPRVRQLLSQRTENGAIPGSAYAK